MESAISELKRLAELPMVVSLVIARSSDERKGRVIVEDAVFTDGAALAAFRAAPQHFAVAHRMGEISDWLIGDYETAGASR